MRRALIRKPTGKKPQIVRERKLYGNDRINYKRNQRNGKIIGTKQIGADEGGKEIERKHRKITKSKHIPTQRKKSDKNPTNQNPRKENGKDHDPTGSGRTEVARCRASIAGGGASLWPRELVACAGSSPIVMPLSRQGTPVAAAPSSPEGRNCWVTTSLAL
jgi:hypothetical protein